MTLFSLLYCIAFTLVTHATMLSIRGLLIYLIVVGLLMTLVTANLNCTGKSRSGGGKKSKKSMVSGGGKKSMVKNIRKKMSKKMSTSNP